MMQPTPRTRSPQPSALSALRALLCACLGGMLLLAFAHTLQSSAALPKHVQAELRVGDERPAPGADVVTAPASLRALSARVRSAAPQPLAGPTWFSSFALPLRMRALPAPLAANAAARAPRRVVSCSWPLPRSSCEDPDASRS